MTPLTLFLLGCATVFLGSIQAAFSALMRLSLRLMAERGGRDDRLGQYLDDPLQLFIPVRILIGVCTVLAGVLIARTSDVRDALSIVTFIVSLVAFVVVCEHLLPLLIVRRDPERVLDVLLPAFHAIATVLVPITALIINLVTPRRERESTNGGNGSDVTTPERASEAEPEEGASPTPKAGSCCSRSWTSPRPSSAR
jgi:CBS domain containing-hemolysin-like protein